jgi:hypothetical protein
MKLMSILLLGIAMLAGPVIAKKGQYPIPPPRCDKEGEVECVNGDEAISRCTGGAWAAAEECPRSSVCVKDGLVAKCVFLVSH